MYQILYNASTNHISGIAERTHGTDFDYPVSACSALSRGAIRMSGGKRFEDLGEALKGARDSSAATGRKLCRNCEKAAEAVIALQATPKSEEELEDVADRKRQITAADIIAGRATFAAVDRDILDTDLFDVKMMAQAVFSLRYTDKRDVAVREHRNSLYNQFEALARKVAGNTADGDELALAAIIYAEDVEQAAEVEKQGRVEEKQSFTVYAKGITAVQGFMGEIGAQNARAVNGLSGDELDEFQVFYYPSKLCGGAEMLAAMKQFNISYF